MFHMEPQSGIEPDLESYQDPVLTITTTEAKMKQSSLCDKTNGKEIARILLPGHVSI